MDNPNEIVEGQHRAKVINGKTYLFARTIHADGGRVVSASHLTPNNEVEFDHLWADPDHPVVGNLPDVLAPERK